MHVSYLHTVCMQMQSSVYSGVSKMALGCCGASTVACLKQVRRLTQVVCESQPDTECLMDLSLCLHWGGVHSKRVGVLYYNSLPTPLFFFLSNRQVQMEKLQ